MIALLFLVQSAFAFSRHHPVPLPVVTPTPIVSPTPSFSPIPIPSGGPVFIPRVTFQPDDYYSTDDEKIKIASAGLKAAQVVQSQCFFDFMSSRSLIQTDGKSPLEVALHLQSLKGVVPVVMYYRARWLTSAVAYRQPPDITINLNSAYFSVDDGDCKWGETMGHEAYGHALGGYDHDYNWSLSRSFSVPYSIGGADKSQGGSAFNACCREN